MHEDRFDHPDRARSRVRTALAQIDRELALLSLAERGQAVRSALEALATELALGPEPEIAPCPHCGSLTMRAATLCGTCWTRLTPPAPARA